MQTQIRQLRFIIDTGAEFSVINPQLCNPKHAVKPTISSLKVLGRNISTKNQFRIPLFKEFNKTNYFVDFLEYPFHKYFDGIIGNNILLNLNTIVDYKLRRIITDDAILPLYFDEEEEISVDEYTKTKAYKYLAVKRNLKKTLL